MIYPKPYSIYLRGTISVPVATILAFFTRPLLRQPCLLSQGHRNAIDPRNLLGLYWDNEKENGNYYLGLRGLGFGFSGPLNPKPPNRKKADTFLQGSWDLGTTYNWA